MFDYLQKFNKLPKEIREKVESKEAMAIISGLEKKYNVNLASIVMKVMVKDQKQSDLPLYFSEEFGLTEDVSRKLVQELNEKIFINVKNYLEFQESNQINKISGNLPNVNPPLKINLPFTPKNLDNKADFYFSPEDEEEIRKLAGKASLEIDDKSPILEEEINKIVQIAKINFSSDFLLGRFKNIIRTYLLGVRDKINATETLSKPFDAGGLAFDKESIKKIFLIIHGQSNYINKPQIKQNEKISPEAINNNYFQRKNESSSKISENIGMRDIEYNLAKENEKKRVDELSNKNFKSNIPEKINEIKKDPVDIFNKNIISGNNKEIDNNVNKQPLFRQTQPITSQGKVLPRPILATEGKRKMDDVKYTPKVLDPIEELKFLSLINFRRLGKTPKECVNKIKEKLLFLEEYKFSKRLEGIYAWRTSPVNKLYLAMGKESIIKKLPILAIIEEKKLASNEFLTEEEFNAIMDLNKEIRY